jgi:NAD+ synthase (glutamine-hydrolysing)
MKISVAQLNYHIGNFSGNKELICAAIKKAKAVGSELIVFSELCVPGYPPLDLLDHEDFVKKCNLTVLEIAAECKGITAIVGAPTFNTRPRGKKLFNSALVLSEGKIVFTANKALLPTYDIFDEYRYFEPEREFSLFSFNNVKIALTICEDLWDEQPFDNKFEKPRLYNLSPMEELAKMKPDFVINISASPFSYSKTEAKDNIFVSKAKRYGIPVINVNQTGANTELIFDGASLGADKEGKVFFHLNYFEEEIYTFQLDNLFSAGTISNKPRPDSITLIHKALITGIRDYFAKSGFTRAILGLSGGIDSSVSLCLATEALGAKNVKALLLPSRYSSEHSVSDSVQLAKNLGASYEIISIEKPFGAFEEALAPGFKGKGNDVTEENLQARIRAVILMAYSNKFGYILLNTSNKSEAAVGYGTLYGDMAGGLSVIGDVYKTDVYKLASFINRNGEIIPENILVKKPSAELKADQFDSDSLPDYKILDSVLYQYIELQRPVNDIIIEGISDIPVSGVLKMINANEYKRYQAPPILRISSKAFGAGRRMPLVASYKDYTPGI